MTRSPPTSRLFPFTAHFRSESPSRGDSAESSGTPPRHGPDRTDRIQTTNPTPRATQSPTRPASPSEAKPPHLHPESKGRPIPNGHFDHNPTPGKPACRPLQL